MSSKSKTTCGRDHKGGPCTCTTPSSARHPPRPTAESYVSSAVSRQPSKLRQMTLASKSSSATPRARSPHHTRTVSSSASRSTVVPSKSGNVRHPGSSHASSRSTSTGPRSSHPSSASTCGTSCGSTCTSKCGTSCLSYCSSTTGTSLSSSVRKSGPPVPPSSRSTSMNTKDSFKTTRTHHSPDRHTPGSRITSSTHTTIRHSSSPGGGGTSTSSSKPSHASGLRHSTRTESTKPKEYRPSRATGSSSTATAHSTRKGEDWEPRGSRRPTTSSTAVLNGSSPRYSQSTSKTATRPQDTRTKAWDSAADSSRQVTVRPSQSVVSKPREYVLGSHGGGGSHSTSKEVMTKHVHGNLVMKECVREVTESAEVRAPCGAKQKVARTVKNVQREHFK